MVSRWSAVLEATVVGVILLNPGTGTGLAQPTPPLLDLNLSPGCAPNPTHLSGISGGRLPATTLTEQASTPTGPCLGFIDQVPNHILMLDTFFENLAIRVESRQDTTLIIRGPGGVWCNDDREGSNPAISGQWLAGDYQVWVGSYQKETYFPYTLYIQED